MLGVNFDTCSHLCSSLLLVTSQAEAANGAPEATNGATETNGEKR
jgi:hypothetical protein